MKNITYFIAFTLILSLLSACGWRLRGTGESLNIQHTIYLASASGTVYEHIRARLRQKKALASITMADIQIELGKEYFERPRISNNDQAQTTQYRLSLSVPYVIKDRTGEALVDESRAELERYYIVDKNALNSAAKEEQLLREEMARQIAEQILLRVQYLIHPNNNTQ
jgi:outer membrane lipopolysaccharide assembly protein LptE/RlpB